MLMSVVQNQIDVQLKVQNLVDMNIIYGVIFFQKFY